MVKLIRSLDGPVSYTKFAGATWTDMLFRGRYEFVVEADIKGFFEHIRHDWLLKMLALRIHDGALLRLVQEAEAIKMHVEAA